MKILFIVFSVFFLTSCSSNNKLSTNVCNVDVPLEDLNWLQEIKEGFEQSASATKKKIVLYEYNNESVFLIDSCNGCADNLTTVYNCEGNIICEFGGIAGINTCPDFETNATKIDILWKK